MCDGRSSATLWEWAPGALEPRLCDGESLPAAASQASAPLAPAPLELLAPAVPPAPSEDEASGIVKRPGGEQSSPAREDPNGRAA